MSKLFSLDVRVYATVYVLAEDESAAMAAVQELKNTTVTIGGGDTKVNGGQYHAGMPDISFSPAATCQGPDEGDTPDEVEDFGEDPDELEIDENEGTPDEDVLE